MDKDDKLLRKRILELSDLSFQRDIPVHTDFLNLNEQTIFHSLVHSFPNIRYRLTGGYDMAERKVVCFLPSYGQIEEDVGPILCVKVEPVNVKFSDAPNHRDYLGALMNLGIDRSKIGDIVPEESCCYVMCMEEMADYIAGELHFIRHTNMKTTVSPVIELKIEPKYETVEGSVASTRLDNILALAYQSSRSKIVPYIESERVFINGRLTTSNSYVLKSGEVVSARGLGKFRFIGIKNETKKGRLFVTLDKYC